MTSGSTERAPVGSRRLLVASVLLALFVLFDLGLLGWLIFRSLSQREIERLLIETRAEAEQLATDIAGGAQDAGKDLYTLIAVEREKQTYIDSVLNNRDIIQEVEIRDREGRLVFRGRAETFDPPRSSDGPLIETGEVPPIVETETTTREESFDYDMDVPIGDLGVLHIGISQSELESRIEVLRGELVRQTGLIGVVTVVVLGLAYLTIWWQWRRGRRLEERAAEQERMAYIGTLASGLAHEIRNPLNSLNLNLQLLEEEAAGRGDSGGSGKRLMAITRQEIRRLERMVTHFLLYAKPRPLELEELPAVELLERCGALLAGEFEAREATLEIVDATGGAAVLVDEEQMTQLLVNLAQNALVATEEGRRPGKVELAARRLHGRIVLEVCDNGAGIPAEERERIFDLFYSTRKGGTGLGLAVVRRVAQAHGSEVTIDSAPGRGTRVRVAVAEAPGFGERPTAELAVERIAPEPAGEPLNRRPGTRTALR